jgi:hypothetical protein
MLLEAIYPAQFGVKTARSERRRRTASLGNRKLTRILIQCCDPGSAADVIDFHCGDCSLGRKVMPNDAKLRQETDLRRIGSLEW